MASSTIDALFQIAAPRPSEPARGSEAAPFDPALRQALAPIRRPEPRPVPASPGDEPAATTGAEAAAAGATDDGDDDRRADDAAESRGEAAPVEDDQRKAEGESAEDETEISEAAAAALAAAEAKTAGRESDQPQANGVLVAAEKEAGVNEGDGGKGTAPAAAEESAGDETAPRSAAIATGVEGLAKASADDGTSAPARTGRDQQAMEHAAATEGASTPRGVETSPEQNAEDSASDKKPAAATTSASDRGEQRGEAGDRTDMKQDRQFTAPTQAADAALVEAPTGPKVEASADHAAAKGDGAPAVAASSSPRNTTGLEKLVGARGLLPAAEEGTSADGGAPVDRARFVQRVEGALRRAQDRDGRLHVRLSPPELGSLRVEIAVQNGVLTAKLEAETTAARNLIMENLPALRERLAQQDVRIERFDVDVRRDGGGSGGGTAGDNGAREHFAERSAWRRDEQRPRAGATSSARVEAAPAAKPQAKASGLDVRV